ncbi:MAG: hypothetical protein ACTSPI_10665, partial [Candidatus Heimdallarchaeaceae archaeon]
KACEQYLKYTDIYWDIPRNIEIEKKRRLDTSKPNYSMYYAVFFGLDEILTYFLMMQKFFFDEDINIRNETFPISNPEDFFKTLFKIINKTEFYISDLKKHAEEKHFGFNESPFDDETVNEAIFQIDLSKIYIKGFYNLYKFFKTEELEELNIIKDIVFINILSFVSRYESMMKEPDFLDSQLADGLALMLEELLLFAGVLALKLEDYSYLSEIEEKFAFVYTKEGMKRYPTINGLHLVIKTTLDIQRGDYKNLKIYSKDLILLSKQVLFEPRNAFSYALLGYLVSTLTNQMSVEQFKQTMEEIFEEMFILFPHSLAEEIKIYLSNLFLALENKQPSYDMRRLLSLQYYDPYSIFIPEVAKLAKSKEIEDIIYLPFNLQRDFLVRVEHSMLEEPEIESTIKTPIKRTLEIETRESQQTNKQK